MGKHPPSPVPEAPEVKDPMSTRAWVTGLIGLASVLILLGVNIISAAQNSGRSDERLKFMSQQMADMKAEMSKLRDKIEDLQTDDRYYGKEAIRDFKQLREEIQKKNDSQDEAINRIGNEVRAWTRGKVKE